MAVWSKIDKSICINRKRFDAERFKPDFIKNELLVSSLPNKKLKHFVREITGGATPLGAKYPNFGVPFVRVQNIRANYIDLSDVVYISEKTHNGELFRSQIKPNDVLLTITGVSYGNSSVSYPEMLPANMNQHSVRISLRETLIPEFLSTFLNCKYGRLQSDSKVTGDTRPALTYNEITNYFIPEISIIDQLKISEIVKQSTSNRLNSQLLYKQATDLLNKELGLNDIVFENKKRYFASFSEVVTTQRLDTTHYQPKFNKLLTHLTTNFDCNRIGCLVSKNRRGLQPNYVSNGLISVVNSKHITSSHLKYDDFEKTTIEDFNSSVNAQIIKGDILIYTTGAYVGATNVYLSEEKALASNHVNILRLKDSEIDSTYLALLLNTTVGKIQTEKYIRGSAQAELYPSDIAKFTVPILDKEKMREIGSLVRESLKCSQESKRLLEQAKLRVEQLIEEAANKQ